MDLSPGISQSAQLRGLNDGTFFQGKGISVINKASSLGKISFETLFSTPRPVREAQISERSSNDFNSEERNDIPDIDFVVENGKIQTEKVFIDETMLGTNITSGLQMNKDYSNIPIIEKRADIQNTNPYYIMDNIFSSSSQKSAPQISKEIEGNHFNELNLKKLLTIATIMHSPGVLGSTNRLIALKKIVKQTRRTFTIISHNLFQ